LALYATLEAGYMGTEENIFSILYYRFPELVHAYMNEEGGNCAIFYEAIHGQAPTPIYHPTIDHAPFGLDTRGVTCTGKEGSIKCVDQHRNQCPSEVTPLYLHNAEGQWSCQNREGSFCTVECRRDSVLWFAHQCPKRGVCPPHDIVSWETFYDSPNPLLPKDPKAPIRANNPVAASTQQKTFTKEEIDFMTNVRARLPKETKDFIKKHGYDLRGLKCEILDGKQACFVEYSNLYRDVCPDWVTAEYLALAADQWSCREDPNTYCIARCQGGTDKIRWTAFDVKWCSDNPEHCQEKPEIIPFDDLYLKKWSEIPRDPLPCTSRSVSEFRHMKPFSVGLLVRGNEIETLQLTLDSYDQRGFIQYVDDFTIMVNEHSPEMAKFLLPYQDPPYNIKVRSSEINEGILNGINWLLGNATHDYFLFLEKDFRLSESIGCTLEQLDAGLNMLASGGAEVVKYRSRYNPGRPNWAESLFRDKEETVFTNQPNLLCNFYHWVEDPDQVWPEHFKVCNKNPLFYCVDAEFCNWTNNPVLFEKEWWFREYVRRFPEFQTSTKDFNLETFMNWAPNAWNDRGWTIAEGEGMFKHCDTNNFGF